MLNEKQTILELEVIQTIMSPNLMFNTDSLKDTIDNLRITVSYMMLDNECLHRELEYAKKKK